jgi:hypothetical protein
MFIKLNTITINGRRVEMNNKRANIRTYICVCMCTKISCAICLEDQIRIF